MWKCCHGAHHPVSTDSSIPQEKDKLNQDQTDTDRERERERVGEVLPPPFTFFRNRDPNKPVPPTRSSSLSTLSGGIQVKEDIEFDGKKLTSLLNLSPKERNPRTNKTQVWAGGEVDASE